MSLAIGGNSRYGDPDGFDPTKDEGYWESLLNDGEVVVLDSPPPWIGNMASPSTHTWGEDNPPDNEQDWETALRYMREDVCCTSLVTGFNRGGLLVEFGKLTGFVPSSHLMDFPSYSNPFEREDELISRVGKELRLRVIEIDRDRGRLILSERIALESERYEQLIGRLNPGDVVTGQVSNLRRFGAFVDLGGFEGLIHISEMSWGRVNHPGDVVQPGDKVQVFVLDVNPEERKIQLSLKRLQPDPWENVVDYYQVGDIVTGEITNVVSFGAFVRLEEGVEGLIHISELAEGNFLHPRNVVGEGQWVDARVLNVDPVKRRIGLSLRQARHSRYPAARSEVDTAEPAGAVVW